MRLRASIHLCVVVLAFSLEICNGATLYWDTDGSTSGNNSSTGANLGGTGGWSSLSANWWNLTSLQAWSDGSDAIFWGGAGTVSPGLITFNSLTFKTTGYLVTSGTITGVTNSTIAVDSNVIASITSTIAGTNTFVKNGAGILVLVNTNNINTATNTGGGWRIDGGTLRIYGDASLGAALPDTARNTVTDIQLNQSTIQAAAPLTVSQNRRTKVNTNSGSNAGDGIIDTAGNSVSWFGSIQGGVGSLKVINSGPNPGILILGTDKIASINPFGSGLPTGSTNLSIETGAIVQTSGTVTPTNGELGAETNSSGGLLTIKLDNGQIRSESGDYTFYRNLVLGPNGGSLDTGAWIQTFFGGNVSGPGGLAKFGTGKLVLDNPVAAWTGGTYIHNGTLQLGQGGSNGLLPGTLGNPSTVIVDAGARLRFNRGSNKSFFDNISGGGGITVANVNNATLRLVSDCTYTDTTIISSGVLMIGQGNPSQPGSIASQVVNNSGTLAFNRVEDITYSGAISGTGGLTKMAAGQLTLAGTSSYTGPTGVAGGTLDVEGVLGTTTVFVTNGILSGSGVIKGPVLVFNTGRFSPDALTISNTLSLTTTMTANVNATANTNSFVRGLTSVSIGGTLTVSNVAGAFNAANAFKLFDSVSYTNAFTSITPTPGPNLAWNTNTLTTDGTLRIVSTVPTQLSAALTANALLVSWPADHTGWRLQTQTNAITTGIGTNWFDVAGSTVTNQISLPIDPAAPCTFVRLIYP